MMATVVWIGGLAAMAIVVIPAARRSLETNDYAAFLTNLQKRLDPWSWFSLAALLATGMVQMSANPNYQGFFAIENRWAVALLLKHVMFFGMVGLSAYLTWGLMPKLRRAALRRNALRRTISTENMGEVPDAEDARLRKQEALLLRINLVLGVLILALTAVARSAS